MINHLYNKEHSFITDSGNIISVEFCGVREFCKYYVDEFIWHIDNIGIDSGDDTIFIQYTDDTTFYLSTYPIDINGTFKRNGFLFACLSSGHGYTIYMSKGMRYFLDENYNIYFVDKDGTIY